MNDLARSRSHPARPATNANPPMQHAVGAQRRHRRGARSCPGAARIVIELQADLARERFAETKSWRAFIAMQDATTAALAATPSPTARREG